MNDRFDLEHRIMQCWEIVDDIRLFRDKYELNDKQDNYMLGLEYLYGAKFEALFDLFEELIHRGNIK